MKGLADHLKSVTRAEHKFAEKTLFARCFVRGAVEPDAYVQLMTDLRIIYRRMESCIAQSDDALVLRVWNPQLARSAAISRDLEVLGSWARPSAAAEQYADHVSAVAQNTPTLLLAHLYTRYLGDLYGGRILGKMVRRGLGFDSVQGTEFYDFGDNATTLRTAFRLAINTAQVSDALQVQLGEEAKRVFVLNRMIFEQLAPVSNAKMIQFALHVVSRAEPPLQPPRRRLSPETLVAGRSGK
jgi:heme oxygenase (biliverdin-producing, ferredoxin)